MTNKNYFEGKPECTIGAFETNTQIKWRHSEEKKLWTS